MPILDRQLRFLLLSHVASSLIGAPSMVGGVASFPRKQLYRLAELSTVDFLRLAASRDLPIELNIDVHALLRAMQTLPRIEEAEWLKSYFLRHGASWQIMRDLFKVRRKLVHRQRREIGAWSLPGRLRLPDEATREAICLAWEKIDEPDLRLRYYRLHQRFPHLLIRVLEVVLRDVEVNP